MNSDDTKPTWWLENKRLREDMGLPEYEPSRFCDGEYTHEILNRLERKHDIDILLMGKDTRYGDDWEITVDGETVGYINRHRDEHSNTVYEQSSAEFCRIIERSV